MTLMPYDDEAPAAGAATGGRVATGAIRGFPEFLPEEQATFERFLAAVRTQFSNAGAVSIVTPLVERIPVLLAKAGGAVTKEMYGLRRLSESDDGSARDLGLKFDLTVPLARYVSQHHHDLTMPFRRFSIDRVHRGERPKSGRYREFWQADFDIVGRGELAIATDAEPPAVIHRIFSETKTGPFVIRISNRKILNGFLHQLGLDESQQRKALAVIDKFNGGHDEVARELSAKLPCDGSTAEEIVRFVSMPVDIDDPGRSLASFRSNEIIALGIDELVEVVRTALSLGVSPKNLKVDLSVVRGLDYYTGTVYETTLLDYPNLGSVCSGGRYDDLASNFSTQKFPGVGISIGVSRLVTRLIEAGILPKTGAFSRHVLATRSDDSSEQYRLGIVDRLRSAGVPTEAFFERSDLGTQLKYADKKGFGFAVILKPGSTRTIELRDLTLRQQHPVSEDELLARLVTS